MILFITIIDTLVKVIMYDEPTVIQGGVATDDRGALRFCNDFAYGHAGIRRAYVITNHQAGFYRAWHGHKIEQKFIQCLRGACRVVGFPMDQYEAMIPDLNKLDLIKDRLSYLEGKLKFFEYFITAERLDTLYIPMGYYHGIQTLTFGAIVQVFSTKDLSDSLKDDYRIEYNHIPFEWRAMPR